MNLISLDRVTKSNGDKKLFEQISFGLEEGQKAALIGANGSGKSTLLKLLAGVEGCDGGTIARNRALKIGYLAQNPAYDKVQTISEFIFQEDTPRSRLLKRYEECTEKLAIKSDEKTQADYTALLQEMEELKIWDYEGEVRAMIKSLGIDDLSRRMGELSGGMLKKVFLAQALIGDCNLLLLDEPTNHLDLDTILWLEDYLRKTKRAMLLVTHDRYFLDHVCSTLLEIDRLGLKVYQGNYSYYLDKKAEQEALIAREDAKIESILRNELEWLKRGPKARGTKQQARIDRIHAMQDRDKYQEKEALELSSAGRRLGNKVLEAKDISKSFDGRKIIEHFTHIFRQNEKIGFLGPNGSGKTTLLNLLTGRLSPDTGTVEPGIHTHFGYFDQHSSMLDPDKTLIDTVRGSAEAIDLGGGLVLSAPRLLERFLFPTSTHYTLVGQLSGGEKRRLALLKVLAQAPNFLVLDEPTNDLDIQTLSVLEDFLLEFGGSLILISHDRYFLDRTVDHLFVFDGAGDVTLYPGTCSDYLEERRELREEEARKEREQKAATRPVETVKPAQKAKLSFKEKQELEKIPGEIEALESEHSAITESFASADFNPETQKKNQERYAEIERILKEKYARWESLMEKES